MKIRPHGNWHWLKNFWPTKPRNLFILVSYRKSGRTWLRVILNELGIYFDTSHDGSSTKKPRESGEFAAGGLFANQTFALPVVFLFRDPRDTVVSAYFWEANRIDNPYGGTIAEFIRDPIHGVETIVRFNLAWLERGSQLPAFLSVTYEQMLKTPVTTIRRIIAYVSAEVADQDIEKAISNNTFERLHQRESAGGYPGGNKTKKHSRRRDPKDPETYKFRRGKAGGYVDYFSPEAIAYCESILTRYRYFEKVDRLMRAYSFSPRLKTLDAVEESYR